MLPIQEENSNSIFENQLTETSAQYIYTAARWAKFLGVVFIILACIILIPAALAGVFAEKFNDVFELAASQNPQAIMFKDLGVRFFMLFLILISLLCAVQGILYIRFANVGKKFFVTKVEQEAVASFISIKHLFQVSVIFQILSLVVTIVSYILMKNYI